MDSVTVATGVMAAKFVVAVKTDRDADCGNGWEECIIEFDGVATTSRNRLAWKLEP